MNQTKWKIRVALVQQKATENPAENLEIACKLIEQAAQQNANVVCLQELFMSKYFCQTVDHEHFQLAELIPGRTTERLSELARQFEIVLVAGLFEKRAPGVYHNSTVVFEADGSMVGHYRKSHIPDDPCFHEKFYFTPGDTGFQVIDTRFGKIGLAICWDQWFPESARLLALSGAEIAFYPTAIGWLPEEKEELGQSQLDAWLTVLRSHAISNGMFVCAPNRVGTEGRIEFWGNSVVIDPYGNILAQADPGEDNVMVTECDLQLIDAARTHWPFLRDRRVDLYQPLTKKWNA
jgi:N-carbamoylputrescine amidase